MHGQNHIKIVLSFGMSYFDDDLGNVYRYHGHVLAEFKESALSNLFWCWDARANGSE